MTSPLKPWELGPPLASRFTMSEGALPNGFAEGDFRRIPLRQGTRNLPSREELVRRSESMEQDERRPPPVPARPGAVRPYNPQSIYGSPFGTGYGGYSLGSQFSPYGSYSMGSYGGSYGSYGPYGSYSNLSRFPSNTLPGARGSFIRSAEETSRPAFAAIESIVQAFGSITMMLESTFFAVHNSFRAVLGVAEQFSNLKVNLLNTLGAFAMLRALKKIYRRILIWLGIRKINLQDDIWNEAASAVSSKEARKGAKSWPVLMFFAVVFGTPWVIWKFLNMMVGSLEESEEEWMTGNGEHYAGKAEFDFEARNEDELTLCAGDTLRIAPKDKQPDVKGWLLATTDGKTTGLVPATYVQIHGRRFSKRKRSTTRQGISEVEATSTNTEYDFENAFEGGNTERNSDMAEENFEGAG